MISTVLTVVRCDEFEDWYCIERVESAGTHVEGFRNGADDTDYWYDSARICDASVEGPLAEMKAIAAGIRTRTSVRFKRCAVEFIDDRAWFRSPRNSQTPGMFTLEEADALATAIEALQP